LVGHSHIIESQGRHPARPHVHRTTVDEFFPPKTFHPNSRPYTTTPQNDITRSLRVSDRIVHTSDATFEQDVLKSNRPVLLDFWAEWCGPCKMIAPMLDEVADEFAERVTVAKLNIDENPQTPPRYGIRGIPTLILFKNGTVEAQKVGALSKAQLKDFLESHL
jgi:thioredoxin 1